MRPHEKHRSEAPTRLSFRLVTVSTSRYQMKKEGKDFTDESGDVAASLIGKAGHVVSGRSLLPDIKGTISKAVKEFLSSGDDVLLLTGGTGVARADVTIEAARPFFEKELEGYGELLRRIGYDEIGAAALLTRATAGISRGKLILCLPGSPEAVETALKSTMAELPHALRVARQ
jgi:molybdopterin adenylyltransferase